MWGWGVSWDQLRPRHKVRAQLVPEFFGTFYISAHGIRISNQILHGDQTMREKFLEGRPRPLP